MYVHALATIYLSVRITFKISNPIQWIQHEDILTKFVNAVPLMWCLGAFNAKKNLKTLEKHSVWLSYWVTVTSSGLIMITKAGHRIQ